MGPKKQVMVVTCLALFWSFLPGCAPGAAPPSPPKASTPPSGAPTPAVKAPPAPLAPSPTAKPVAGQPKYGGVLTQAVPAEPASFDLHQEAGAQHLLLFLSAYNGLLQHDPLAWPEPKIISDLATSWEVSSDGLQYTFRLRSGVKWHDGRPFTSEDVKASLDRIRTPPRGMKSPRQASFPSLTGVEAIAPDAVRIRLSYPSASLLSNLAMDWLAMLPKHVLEAKGDMKQDILGTGPFKLKGFSPASSYEYVKNSEYFVRGRPYLDGIRIFVVRDAATRFAALRTSRVLYLPFPYGVTPTQAEVAKADPRLVVQSNWRTSLARLSMNFNRPPWGDSRVRRAIFLAIDRQAFIATVLEGNGLIGAPMPSRGPWGIPEDELLKMPGYRQPKDADMAEARKLLGEAGFPDGFAASIMTRSDATYERYGTFILAELAKLGIKGEHLLRVTAAFEDSLLKGAFDMMAHSEATALDDPDLRFGDFYISRGGRNYGKYNSAKIDELNQQQSRALDVNERKKLVREMQMIIFQDNPDVPLAWGITQIAHDARLKNYKIASSPLINNRHQEVWLAD